MIQNGIYQHYKGKKYCVLFTARHTETDEELVVYVPLYEHPNGGIVPQCRPRSMFEGLVPNEAGTQFINRFTYVGTELNPKGK